MTANWPIPAGYGGIPKDRRSRHARRDLLEQLQPFPAQAVFELHKAGGVAARPRQAIDEAGADRIGDDREHDRHGAGRLQQRRHGRGASGQDDVRRERDQFRRVFASVVGICRAPQRMSIRTLRPSVQPNCCSPCRNAAMRACASGSSAARVHEHADAPHALGLLRARRERPRSCRAAQNAEKFPPPHVRP